MFAAAIIVEFNEDSDLRLDFRMAGVVVVVIGGTVVVAAGCVVVVAVGTDKEDEVFFT